MGVVQASESLGWMVNVTDWSNNRDPSDVTVTITRSVC